MNAVTAIEPALAKLRAPFPDHQVSKLPKETKKQADDRKADMARGKWPAKCAVCEGYHHPQATHLDYVGHAALTDRLLDVDPEWSWEPLATDANGLPAYDANRGLWIKLTVLGVTRLGYGAADGKSGGDAVKEMIGDALRNAAMRFGAALDLWHKGDLHLGDEEGQSQTGEVSPPAADPHHSDPEPKPKRGEAHSALKTLVRRFVHGLNGCSDSSELQPFLDLPENKKLIADVQEKLPDWWEGWPEQPDGFTPLRRLIELREAECAEVTASYATV